MLHTFQELRRAIEACNARKGYGEVSALRMIEGGNALRVTIERPHMRDTIRTARIVAAPSRVAGAHGQRIRFAGTSARIPTFNPPCYN